jgi:RimJ/RimL family protein N-acetyltransferase
MDIQTYIIETKRTKIRPLTPKDAEHFYMLNQDPEVLKYTGDVPFKNIDAAREFLEKYDQYEKYGVGRMAVIDKETHEFLGWCGLKYSPNLDEYDIGFRFFKKYWNKGYATETSEAFIDYGFNALKLNEIVGRAMVENIASVKVLQKIGMILSKTFDFEGHKGVIYSIKSNTIN